MNPEEAWEAVAVTLLTNGSSAGFRARTLAALRARGAIGVVAAEGGRRA